MDTKQKSIIECRSLTKIYKRGNEEVRAVNGVDLSIDKGEIVSVVGPSGSGKTTLVNILGCLDNPSSGQLFIEGSEIFGEGRVLSERELTKIRRKLFGYIFQKFYLIPTLTVLENVMLPLTFQQNESKAENAEKILTSLDICHRKDHLPGEISGGEMQRVAIARALINDPRILLADEPTGNLDTKRSSEIGEIFSELNKKMGITIIIVTHNPSLAKITGRTLEICDGKILR